MTAQMKDPFIWNQEKWTFIGAEDVYSLFDPQKYGLTPTMANTACYKGFIVQFAVIDNSLFLEKLLIRCKNNLYPPINGINPVPGDYGMTAYNDIHLPLSYTGKIIVGNEMKPEFHHRAFTGPHSYAISFELSFIDGTLVESNETSGSYIGF